MRDKEKHKVCPDGCICKKHRDQFINVAMQTEINDIGLVRTKREKCFWLTISPDMKWWREETERKQTKKSEGDLHTFIRLIRLKVTRFYSVVFSSNSWIHIAQYRYYMENTYSMENNNVTPSPDKRGKSYSTKQYCWLRGSWCFAAYQILCYPSESLLEATCS